MGAGGGEKAARLAFKPQKEFDFADGGLGHYAILWSWSWSSLRMHAEQLEDHSFAKIEEWGKSRAVVQH